MHEAIVTQDVDSFSKRARYRAREAVKAQEH